MPIHLMARSNLLVLLNYFRNIPPWINVPNYVHRMNISSSIASAMWDGQVSSISEMLLNTFLSAKTLRLVLTFKDSSFGV